MTKRRQGFAFDVFGDDQQRLAGVGDFFQHRDEVADVGDFLFVDEHVAVVELAGHALRIGHEVGREIAPVELHAFFLLDGRFRGLCLLRR